MIEPAWRDYPITPGLYLMDFDDGSNEFRHVLEPGNEPSDRRWYGPIPEDPMRTGDCRMCGGTGQNDSGGSREDGTWISVPCAECHGIKPTCSAFAALSENTEAPCDQPIDTSYNQ